MLRRAYFRRDGTLIGELFNVQTPAEIDDRGVRYVDLEVDVVRLPGGQVAVVDEDDLEAAVRDRRHPPGDGRAGQRDCAPPGRDPRCGRDWRTADADRPGRRGTGRARRRAGASTSSK